MDESSNKISVLMLNYEYPPLGGGAANATKHILEEMAKRPDLEIDLVSSSVDKYRQGKLSDNITLHFLDIGKGGNIHYQSMKDLLVYAWKSFHYSKRLMKQKSFDICHAFFGIPCGYVAMKLGLPYIVSLRGSDVPFYNPRFEMLDKLLFKRMSKKIWRKAAFTVANSQGLKDLALASSADEEIDVIYNGVDSDFYKPAVAKSRTGELKIVSTGRLIKRKGYNFLIDALAGMKDVSVTFVGSGNIEAELKEQCERLKVDARFCGAMDKPDMLKELQQADLFVLPSLNEGMSNSVLEAMSCGLPVIVTRVGGSEELVDGNGFIVEPGSSEGLRQALEKFVNDEGLLDKCGSRSREIAVRLTWELSALKYEDFYHKLSDNKNV